jgi:SAM-dependent methyltransferase
METTACNFCGSEDAAVIFNLPDLLLDLPEVRTTLVRCRNCGLVYQNPRPAIEEMSRHYPPEYVSYAPNPVVRRTPWLLRRAYDYGVRKRVRTVTRVADRGALLDVGCATGTFLLGMRRYTGLALTGVEISLHAAAVALAEGLDVRVGTLEEARFPDAAFDIVTLWDVFEHLHDPTGSLVEIARILKPGGGVVIRVPNLDSWDARLFGRYWAGLDAPRHTYVFDLQNLRNMLGAAGFTDLEMRCNIGSYPTFALSVRFWLTGRGVAPEWRRRIMRLLENPFARLASAPLFYFLSLGLRGPLVTVTARVR